MLDFGRAKFQKNLKKVLAILNGYGILNKR